MPTCDVPKPRYGTPEDHDRARQLGKRIEAKMREQGLSAESLAEMLATVNGPGAVFVERIIHLRNAAGMTETELGYELGVGHRTVKKMEAGQAPEVTFNGGQGAANVRRLVHGELSWSGSSSTKRWVGPGYELVAQLEKIFAVHPGTLARGIWLPIDSDSLQERVRRDPVLLEGTKDAIVSLIEGDARRRRG